MEVEKAKPPSAVASELKKICRASPLIEGKRLLGMVEAEEGRKFTGKPKVLLLTRSFLWVRAS